MMPHTTPIRVVHLTSAHRHDDLRIFVKMCRSLAKNGYDVHIVAPREDAVATEVIDGVTVHPVVPGRNRYDRMTRVTRDILEKSVALEAVIYHFHDPELLRRALSLKRRTGALVIYDAHEDLRLQILEKSWLPFGSRRLMSWFFGHYEDFIAGRLSGVVCATPSIAERFRSRVPCEVIQNYPLSSELCQAAPEAKVTDPYVVYAGGFAPERGIIECMEAMNHIRSRIKLYLAGWDASGASSTAFNERTKFLGLLSRDKLPGLLCNALAGLVVYHPLPNHVNAQPNKLFEYMAAGIPVIASDFPLWRTIIEGNECGLLVDPMDPRSIAKAIDYLSSHPLEAQEMGKKGREAVLTRYNWSAEERKLLDFYGALTGREGLERKTA